MTEENINTEHLKTPGERLDFFITKYFGKQIAFVNKMETKPDAVSRYVADKVKITHNVALKMQKKTGVNADFILNGNLPVVIDNTIEPIFEGNIPTKTLSKRQDTKLVNRRQMQLTISGANEVLKDASECNIVEFAYANIKNPLLISVISPKFCDYYKIAIGSLLVLSDEVEDGNIVLVKVGRNYQIAKYIDNQFTEYKTDKKISIQAELIGSLHAKVERF